LLLNLKTSLNLVPNWPFEFGQIIMISQGEYQHLTLATPTNKDYIANYKIVYHKNCRDVANTPE
jgi:hypothetical protein